MNPSMKTFFGMKTTTLPLPFAERGDAMSITFGILIFLIAMLGLVFPAQGAAPANEWWDSNYQYREKITITAGSVNVPTQYSVRIQFDHAALVTAAKSLSSGNDIRVVYWNGSTWTELDRRLDDQSSWNSTTTQVWFRTQAAINANQRDDNYYIYYGYSSAGTPPTTWSNIFLFYDDFNDGTLDTARWTCLQGTCNESSGTLTLGPSVNSQIWATATYLLGVDTRWETRVQLGGDGTVQYFNYCAAGNTSDYSDDWIDMWTTSSAHSVETANEGTNGQDPYTPTTPTSFHVYTFDREGTSGVRFFQDGTQVGYRTANVPDENLRFLSHNDNTSSSQVHDWVRVRKYVTPEPTNFTGGEEVKTEFSYRKQITINESQVTCTSDLTSFPVMVNIASDNDLRTVANNGHVQNANGYDIIFRDSSGNMLDHEVEKYLATTGELVAWVRIPSLDYNDNTIIYMYYGNGAITSSTENKTGVWDGNYQAVWHLNQTSGGTDAIKDSTGNARHGTDVGSPTLGATGQIDGAIDFGNPNTTKRVDTKDFMSSGITQFTAEAWVYKTATKDARIIYKNNAGNTGHPVFGLASGGTDTIRCRLRISDGSGTDYNVGTISLNTWTHVACTYDGSNIRAYKNGIEAGFVAETGTLAATNDVVVIAQNEAGTSVDRHWPGLIDEARVSNIARTGCWLETEYNNQKPSSTFLTVGSEQDLTAFDYYKEITIDHTKVGCASLTNFPMLVSLSGVTEIKTQANGGRVQSTSGYDIIFRDTDGNQLDHEVERYDGSAGDLFAWVRIPTLVNTADTTIYMYYGNSSIISPTENPTGVWDSNYKGVWHLKESGNGTSGEFKDSTSNAKHGTGAAGVTGGGTPDRADARIGYGQNFRGDLNANDAINLGKGTGLDNLGTYSLEAWIAPRSLGETNYGRVICKSPTAYNPISINMISGNALRTVQGRNGDGNGPDATDADMQTANDSVVPNAAGTTWYHVVKTFDGIGLAQHVYINGVEASYSLNQIGSGTLDSDAAYDWLLGNWSGGDRDFNGFIDEVRISNTVRSACSIQTQYNNQSAPSSFYTLGTEQSASGFGPLVAWSEYGTDDHVVRYKTYSSGWGAEGTAADTGGTAQVRWHVAETSPDGTEQVVLIQEDVNDRLYATLYDGTNWDDGGGAPFNDFKSLGTFDSACSYRAFDAAYEQTSGNLLIVQGTNVTNRIQYWVWDGSSWVVDGATYTFNTATINHYIYWLELASHPTNNQIALMVLGRDQNAGALIWDGDTNTWQSATEKKLNTNTVSTYVRKPMDVQYMQAGANQGQALFAWAEGSPYDIYSWTWTGSGWEAAVKTHAAGASTIYWVRLAADPRSDDMLLGYYQFGDEIHTIDWDGSAWGTDRLIDADGFSNYTYSYPYDIIFESASGHEGHAIIVYSDTEQLRYQHTADITGAWGGEQTPAAFLSTDDCHWVQLVRDSDGTIYMAGQDDGDTFDNLIAKTWDNTTWTDEGPLDTPLPTGSWYKFFAITARPAPVDNTPPADATWGTITPGDQQIELNWTNPVSDFNKVVILRREGSAVGDAPAEGTEYSVGNTIGSSTVRYVGSLETFTDTGLTNGTNYYYKIFAYDDYINYASGTGTGPHTPTAAAGGGYSYRKAITIDYTKIGASCGSITDTWQVSANNRDAWGDTNTGNINQAFFGDLNWLDAGGYQWAITIPQGATITSAKVRVYSTGHSGATGAYTARIRVEDVDNASAFTGDPDDIYTRTYWGTTVDWGIPAAGLPINTWSESPDITSLIQHVVNRAGWSAGNYLSIAIWGQTGNGGSNEYTTDYNSNASLAAQLEVTYQSGSSSIQDFPVMVKLTGADFQEVEDNVDADGYDIIFKAEDDTTCGGVGLAPCALDHEIEVYDETNDLLIAWVRVPTLSVTADTRIYMYYGNPAITSPTENATGVWSNNFREVFHFKEPSGTLYDSTSSGYTGTVLGTATQGVSGMIGAAVEFDGAAGSRVTLADGTMASNQTFTFSAWVRADTLANQWEGIVTKGRDSNDDWQGLWINGDNRACFGWEIGNLDGSVVSTGQWYYVAGTYDGANRRLYLNDALDAGPTAGGTHDTDIEENTLVGADYPNGSTLDGIVDEVRISTVARDLCWLQTEYNNQNTPATFYEVGSEEPLDFNYYKPLTIQSDIFGASCGDDLVDFPVLVSLSGVTEIMTTGNGGHVYSTSGYDIIFKDINGVKLDHEIEYYSGTNGDLVAWVRIPVLEYGGSTVINMYYGNSSVTASTENVTGVWDSNYVDVQHMQGGTYSALDDSTSNNNDVTYQNGAPTYQQAGKMGYAVSFDGTDDAVDTQDSTSLDIASQLTVSAWIRPTSTAAWSRIVAKSHTVNNLPFNMYALLFDDANHLRMEATSGGTRSVMNGTSTVPTDGSWTYATVTYDHTALRIYFNGAAEGTPVILTTDLDPNDMPLSIARSGFGANYFAGHIDEVRVSNIARDECWIGTEYRNQNAPGTYIDVGTEVAVTDVSLGNHAAGQETDKFTSESSVTGAELFAFKLTNNIGSGVTVEQIQFELSGVSGILQTDFANLAIYIDTNGDGAISGESTTVGGTGSVSAGVTTITFTGDFAISAGTTVNYILKGDVSNLVAGDTVTIALGTSNITLASGTVGGSAPTNVTHTADAAGGLTQIHYRWRNDDGAEQGSANWWNTSYLYRKKVTFGTSHSLLPLYYTVTVTMDTRPANTNVELTTGNDVRVVWQPTAGGATELDRIGSTWNSATTNIDFRLQSEIGANLNEDPDGTYYIYYGNASAGTPPTNEMNVYYFADFFNRADSTSVGNGWQEWNDAVLSDMYLQTNALYSKGNNIGPPDAGVKQNFPLGAIPGDFTLSFDVTIQTNAEGIWTHYVNVGNSGTMVDSSRTTGVGPGIYFGEGAHFVPDSGNYNISNDLTGNMETGITGAQSIRMVVNRAGQTYDYYRGGTPIVSGQTYVTSQATLNQIRIANDQYSNPELAFIYDNLKIVLNVASTPAPAAGTEEAYQASGATWAAAEDTKLVGLAKDTIKRIRFEISNEGASTSGAVTYQLQVAQTSTCGSGTYSAVPTDTSGHWQITDSTYLTDGAATTDVASGLTNEATTFVPGQVKDTGNTTGSITLNADQFTELEFAVKATSNAVAGADYCFMLVSASGTSISTYLVYGQVSIAAPNLTQIHYRWRNDDGSEGGFEKGTGADGALAPTGTFNLNTSTSGARSYADGIAYRIDASNIGANSVTRYSGTVALSNGIAAGDEVILINLQGASGDTTDVGNYEFLRVQSVTASTITFTTNITKSYDGTTPANQKVIVQRVPNYTSVTLDSTDALTASAWDGLATTPTGAAGYYSGLVAFRATGTVSVGATASISASGLGYRLGNGVPGDNQYGYQAESYTGNPGAMTPAINAGGGGGGDLTNVGVDSCGEGGGGGGYGTTGTAGGYGSLCGGSLPMNNGGATYGIADLSKIYLGSGGGGGASDEHSTVNSGSGARGAGIVVIFADTITVSGTLSANGANAPSTPAGGDNGMGGGGSGGSIYLAANTATLGTNLVTTAGGAGGPNTPDPTWIGAGGAGGVGRIRIECDSISGSTSPSASTAGTPGGTGATWAEDQDTALDEAIPGKIYRLRFEVSNEGTGGSGAVTYKLQVAQTDTCGSGAYTDVPTDTSGHFQIINSSYLTDGGSTTDVISGLTNEASTFVAGQVKDTGNTTGSITLNTNQFTELEFAVQATDNSVLGANYCFRLVAASGTEINTYSVYGQIGVSDCEFKYSRPITIDRTKVAETIIQDAASSANTGSVLANTLSWSHTVGTGNNRILIVGVSLRVASSQTVQSVTYGGTGLTYINAISNGTNTRTEMWYLKDPTPGTNTIQVTISGGLTTRMVGGAASFFNVDQSNPLGTSNTATGSSTTASVTVSSAEGELVVNTLGKPNSTEPVTVGAGQTQLWNNVTTNATASNNVIGGGSTKPGATSVTMQWTWSTTNRAWAMVAVPLKPAGVTNYPMLVSLTDTALKTTAYTGGHVESSSGYDLIFRDSNGDQLDHEIEKYVGSTGELVAWVRIPYINGKSASSDTVIYMYYGNKCITTSQEDIPGVWDTNFKGVWHLKESGNGTADEYMDSTLNDNDAQGGAGTSSRAPTQTASGKIGPAQDFNRGETDFISIPDAASLQITGSITLEAWGYADSFLAGWQFPNLVARQYGTGAGDAYTLSVGNGTASSAPVYGWFNGSVNSTSNVSSGAWYHLAVTVSSSGEAYIYVNGVQVGSATGITIPTDSNPTLIGGQENDGTTTPTADSLWDGIIDEVRISNNARTAGWIQTEYNNQNSPSTFYSIGSEVGAAPTSIDLLWLRAKGQGSDVLVSWETAQEINNFGFHVYRSGSAGGPYARITDRLIPGLTFSVRGRDYSYVDRSVTRGRLYYYKLEDIDMDGSRTMHGPVCVDWDGDGIPDDWEQRYGLNPAVDDSGLDPDGDGLTNLQEYYRGTDPLQVDTDGDGVRDSQEYYGSVTEGLMRGVEVIASDATGMTLELRTDDFETVVLDEGGVSYRRLRVPEYVHGYTEVVGKPELPVKGILLDLPAGYGGTLSIESVESLELSNYWIYPVPEKVMSGEGELATVTEVFVIDEAAYRLNSFYPDVVARVGETYDYRGQKKLQVFFNPFSFNPVTGELVQYTRIRVRVEYVALAEEVPVVRSGVPLSAPDSGLARAVAWVPPDPASAYKMVVSEQGIYRLTGAWLASQGVSVSDWSQVRVYHLGQEIPVYQGGDYIEFYGTPPSEGYSKYTKHNVYWLTTSGGSGTPLRMGTIDGTPGTAGVPSTHVYAVHEEKDQEYLGEAPGPESLDRWVFKVFAYGSGVAGAGPVHYPITLPGVGGTQTGQVSVLLCGLTTLDHDVRIAFNGVSLGTYQWSGFEFYEVSFSDVPLLDGVNTLTLTCLSGSDPMEPDGVALDWVEVAYPRKYEASGNGLKITHNAGYKYQVGNFTNSTIQAYDITTPTEVKRITNVQVSGTNPYTLTMEPRSGSGERTYLTLSTAATKTPVSITKDTAGNLSGTGNGADYLLITHRNLGWDGGGAPRPWLANLKAHREAEGLRVKVVDVEDIFDEFSYGILSPQGIKDFLSYTYQNWVSPAPQYVLLVGDSAYDPKDNYGLGTINYVPTYLARTPFMGESLTDEWFVRISGNDALADMDIGRLPAATTAQAETMVNKIISYETAPVLKTWERNTLLVADNQVEGYEVLFELMNEDAAGLLPAGMNAPFREYLNDYVLPGDLTVSMRNRLNVDGALIWNYSGHGSVQVWASENIFSTGTVATLSNSGKLPFVVAMTCLNGFFGYPEGWNWPSLAEALLRNSSNGAVAAFMSTGMTEPEGQRVLDQALFEGIFKRDYRRLGRAISYAKQELVANSVALGEVGKTFLLFGDPAMKLKVPLPTAPTAPAGQVSGSSVWLSWGASVDANGVPVAGYNLYRSTTPNGPYTKVNSSLITSNQYTDNSVQVGTYYYVVKSVDGDGDESAGTLEMTVAIGARSVGGSGSGGGGGGCFISAIAN